MATTQHPLLRGHLSRVFLFVLFLMQCWTAGRLAAQVEIALDQGASLSNDTVVLTVTGHGKYLDPPQSDTFVPHVRFLYIFGDGNFLNGVKDSVQKYRYPYTLGALPSTFDVRTYHTPIYSGGKPPPKRVAPITPPASIPASPNIKQVVAPGRNIYLQRNQDVSKNDTVVSIVSFKNRTTDTISGNIFLFFNDKLVVEEKMEDGSIKKTPLSDNALFKVNESMVYSPKVNPETYLLEGISANGFENAAMLGYSRLAPQEEIHLFLEMEHDSTMFAAFTGEKKITTDLLAVMTAFEQFPLADSITENERALLSKLNFNNFLELLNIDNIDIVLNSQQSVPDFLGDIATNILDISLMTPQLVKAHDPNQVIAEACACTDKNGVQKVVITVDCENDGSAPTEIVIIEVFIPAQLDFNSIAAQPISYLPALSLTGPRSITMTKDAARRSITWTMRGFHLMGNQVVGYGHPLSQGQIVFTALTNAGVALSAIDPIHACIRFSSAADAEVVCTPKAAVQAIWDGPDTQGQLQCLDDCKCPPPKIPRWLWYVLVALILLIALFRWWRNNNP